jgi:RimJ/RimL family protein N-acetyltransferase
VKVDPPYRIASERLLLRCWEPEDAPLLKEAVDESLDELLPWMPWAAEEPQPLSAKVGLLRGFRGRFDLGQEFVYGIFAPDESAVLGGTGLHTRRGEDAFEIGYWIRTSHAGRGLATESSAVLTRVAFELCGVDRVDIRVDPANTASARIPRKLGFREEATLRRRLGYPEPRDVIVFSLFADELAGTPSAEARFEAWDAAGARVM